MIEYIFDSIRAVAGQDAEVTAVIKDEDGSCITDGCTFMLHDKDGSVLSMVEGTCNGDLWYFNIPAKDTEGLKGRYMYCIQHAGCNLCFTKPFYLV